MVQLGFARGARLSATSLFTSQPHRSHSLGQGYPSVEERPDTRVGPLLPGPVLGRVWAGEEAGGRGWVPMRGHRQDVRGAQLRPQLTSGQGSAGPLPQTAGTQEGGCSWAVKPRKSQCVMRTEIPATCQDSGSDSSGLNLHGVSLEADIKGHQRKAPALP